MLFNSFAFLLAFLPASLIAYYCTTYRWRLHVLAALSLVFYGYWDWWFIPLLVCSVLLNWIAAIAFSRSRRYAIIVIAIIGNLGVLALFKYADFLLDGLRFMQLPIPKLGLVLPLGISFFTFHHIMYLRDLGRGQAPTFSLLRYALYIGFFPQVLSGPLVRWTEIMHQFGERAWLSDNFTRGATLLTIGLGKKVFLADPLSTYVVPVFTTANTGPVTIADAWLGTLSFTFQIYFDFSGYTDMALGIALLFGITLPQNFNVPYRAASLQDFWRRWHMTLSRFLRDYLYIPLGGNRYGITTQMGALLATMLLGGLWHGAALTFVAWGLAHGVGLAAGIAWRHTRLRLPTFFAWFLTFLFVVLCWVLFRAETFVAAARIFAALFGHGAIGSSNWGSVLLIVASASVAMLGPTAWTLTERLPLGRSVAFAIGLLFALALLKVGDGGNYVFIYFQF